MDVRLTKLWRGIAQGIVGLIGIAVPIRADIIDFESMPDVYFFNGGGQNVGTFYSGMTFGPNLTGLSVSRFGGYNDGAYPPHSGDVVIWDAFDSTIGITFASAVDAFGIWYTSFDPLQLDAFDSAGSLLGTVIGAANTDGTLGTSSFLSFTAAGIASVNLTSSAGQFVLDDLATGADVAAVPEPGTVVLLIPTLLLLLLRGGRRRIGASNSEPRGQSLTQDYGR